jgi:sec-independent protein translocase protein TatA
MFGVSPFQMMVVLIVILLLFGSRLPSAMGNLGKSLTMFKKGMQDDDDDDKTRDRDSVEK